MFTCKNRPSYPSQRVRCTALLQGTDTTRLTCCSSWCSQLNYICIQGLWAWHLSFHTLQSFCSPSCTAFITSKYIFGCPTELQIWVSTFYHLLHLWYLGCHLWDLAQVDKEDGMLEFKFFFPQSSKVESHVSGSDASTWMHQLEIPSFLLTTTMPPTACCLHQKGGFRPW